MLLGSAGSLWAWLRAALCALVLAGASASAQAPLDLRVALVIGNSAYDGAPLPNPANDAKAMAEVLRGLGFTVMEVQDAKRAAMTEAIARIRDNLRGKKGVGMLYYAGHGLQLDWRNYMVPVDAKLNSAGDVASQAVDVNSVIDAFKAAGNRMNILVLDACRDNPFGSIASGKGLAQLDAPPGTFLAYATAPGNVAEDGDVKSGNGLYTQYLLQELRRPAARIEDVFKRVRLSVRKQSDGRQIPWESTSLEDDFYFNDGTRGAISAAELERMLQDARARERELLRQTTEAREREARIARELEQERARLAEARRLAELAAKAQAEEAAREHERQYRLAQEQEAQRLADAQRIADAQARRKAEEESRERERQLRLAQEQERERQAEALRLAQAEAARQAEAQARERERQLQLAQRQERERAVEAERVLAEARRVEQERLRQVETAKNQVPVVPSNRRLSDREIEQQFLLEKAEWDLISGRGDPDAIYTFLQKYPSGHIAPQALATLQRLAVAKVTYVPDRSGVVQEAGGPRFRLGDEWTMSNKDGYSGAETRRTRYEVTKIEKDMVEVNHGDSRWTIDGGFLRDATTVWDPPLMLHPGDELATGKKWSSSAYTVIIGPGTIGPFEPRAVGQKRFAVLSFRILGVEDVTVPAGTFRAYKCELISSVHGWRTTDTYWLEPGWPRYIKMIRVARHSYVGTYKEEIELVSRKRGGS